MSDQLFIIYIFSFGFFSGLFAFMVAVQFFPRFIIKPEYLDEE